MSRIPLYRCHQFHPFLLLVTLFWTILTYSLFISKLFIVIGELLVYNHNTIFFWKEESYEKLIQLIDKFDGPQSTLSNEEFFIREKLLLYLKLFWVFSIVIFVLLGIIVSISYFFYFFYYAIILWIITKVLDMLLYFYLKKKPWRGNPTPPRLLYFIIQLLL